MKGRVALKGEPEFGNPRVRAGTVGGGGQEGAFGADVIDALDALGMLGIQAGAGNTFESAEPRAHLLPDQVDLGAEFSGSNLGHGLKVVEGRQKSVVVGEGIAQ